MMMRAVITLPLALVLAGAEPAAQRERPAPEPLYNARVDPALPMYRPGGTLTGSLKGICSETFRDRRRLWLNGSGRYSPAVTFEVAPTGGGVGSKALAEGQVDFAAVTREISPADEALFVKRYGYKPLEIP